MDTYKLTVFMIPLSTSFSLSDGYCITVCCFGVAYHVLVNCIVGVLGLGTLYTK